MGHFLPRFSGCFGSRVIGVTSGFPVIVDEDSESEKSRTDMGWNGSTRGRRPPVARVCLDLGPERVVALVDAADFHDVSFQSVYSGGFGGASAPAR
jgi:hypothetical protein